MVFDKSLLADAVAFVESPMIIGVAFEALGRVAVETALLGAGLTGEVSVCIPFLDALSTFEFRSEEAFLAILLAFFAGMGHWVVVIFGLSAQFENGERIVLGLTDRVGNDEVSLVRQT